MIYFVTSNKGKFAEAREIFEDLVQKNIGYPELQADTLEEVVAFGLVDVTARLKVPVIIEDAGLFIEGLKGFPGVYSAYVQKTLGNPGILKLMEGVEDRRAYFASIVGYAEPGMEPVTFRGEVWGTIGFEARGDMGFGYDPIFYLGDKSLAQVETEEKNKMSHRGRSMRALKEWLDNRHSRAGPTT
jgi:XTP/dITP diphosphohydrolase